MTTQANTTPIKSKCSYRFERVPSICWGKMGLFLVIFITPFILLDTDANAYTVRKTTDGKLIRWNKASIRYHMTDSIKGTQYVKTIKNGFERWNDKLAPKLRLEMSPKASDDTVGFDKKSTKNTNLVHLMESDWPSYPEALAITVTTYDQKTGEILDSDILLNGEYYHWNRPNEFTEKSSSVGTGRPLVYSMESVVLHEVGHLLGLEHSQDKHAVMYRTLTTKWQSKMALHQDDLLGLHTLYPPAHSHGGGHFRKTGDAKPADPSLKEEASVGCSTAPSTFQFNGLAGLCCVLTLLFFLRRRHVLPILIGASTLFASSQAKATTETLLSFSTLQQRASTVVEGQVIHQKSHWERKLIFTTSTFQVKHCVKGSCKEKTVQIKQLGGKIGRFVMVARGIQILPKKVSLLLFLKPSILRPKTPLRVVGAAQGVFRVLRKNGQKWLLNIHAGEHYMALSRMKQGFSPVAVYRKPSLISYQRFMNTYKK